MASPQPYFPDGDRSIGRVCEETGVSARTVRYYEELGLLPGVRRRSGGRRVYGDDEVERLRFIQRLKAMGLSLQEVADLNAVYAINGSTNAMLERLRELLRGHLDDIDEKLETLSRLRDEMSRYLTHVEGRIARKASPRPGRNGRRKDTPHVDRES